MSAYHFVSSNKRLDWAVAALLLVATPTTALFAGVGHAVSLRIVDTKTGKPIQKVTASIVKWSKNGQVEVLAQGTTNAEGLIVFNLSEPMPERIGFDFSPNELKYCSDLAFSTEEILHSGVLAQNKCQTGVVKLPFVQKAGEITLFAGKVSIWERIRRELP
jgi:5-hydroxyisourate hydrolase-like protein (transthyretin family)